MLPRLTDVGCFLPWYVAPLLFVACHVLDCYSVGSLDFNFCGNKGLKVFSATPNKLSTFCRGVVAATKCRLMCA